MAYCWMLCALHFGPILLTSVAWHSTSVVYFSPNKYVYVTNWPNLLNSNGQIEAATESTRSEQQQQKKKPATMSEPFDHLKSTAIWQFLFSIYKNSSWLQPTIYSIPSRPSRDWCVWQWHRVSECWFICYLFRLNLYRTYTNIV